MIAIIVDVSVVMNNKMNGICSMNEKPEMHVLFLVKKNPTEVNNLEYPCVDSWQNNTKTN